MPSDGGPSDPDAITSNVVTKETVCIALTMAALHNLDVKVADVLNTYVMTTIEKTSGEC